MSDELVATNQLWLAEAQLEFLDKLRNRQFLTRGRLPDVQLTADGGAQDTRSVQFPVTSVQ
ncbi:MAG: hypothetical protein NTX53_03385 [candidate division WOR-3 bacterium]|nr:hypothetical protein [candidate division WOR-3 bacterium]